jgi:YhgE/Pip-like protein
LWLPTGAIVGLLSLLFSLLYMGANKDPMGSLRDLPIALVNADKGAEIGGKKVNLGDQITASVAGTSTSKGKVSWKQVNRAEATKRLGKGKVFGALVIPENFSASVASLGDPSQKSPRTPTLTVLTNRAAGSIGSSLASQFNQAAAHAASAELGKKLTQQMAQQAKKQKASAASAGGELSALEGQLLADPVHVTVEDGHPLSNRSGLGLSAFYLTLVLILCGMMSANVIHNQVDVVLGYAASDLGPIRTTQPEARISRTRHFAIASVLMLGLSILIASAALVAAVWIVGIDAPHLALLWIYSVCVVAAIGTGTLSLLAVFGTPGVLVAMLVIVTLAIPSAGATMPLEALPRFYQFLAEFEPFRQVVDGVRSILYFDAQGDAGLLRGWISVGIAFVVAIFFGFGVTHFYDRKGLHRYTPEASAEPAPAAAG